MLKEDKCRWMALLKEDVPDLDLQKYSGSIFLFSKRSAVNPFWRDVFSSFARFSERCIPQTISEFLQEPILFHHKIKSEETVISRQVWRRLGIRTIGQLTSENLEFLEYSRFITKFGNDINFLEYYGMIEAIKKYKESLHLKDEPSPNTTEAKPYAILQSERKGTKAIRNILRQNIRLLPKAVAKWNNTFLDLDWPAIYSSLKNSTSDTRLKWFQYRILHRVLTTNDYLYKRKVIDSDRCTFCKTEKETISHLLWDCTYTETFWKHVLEWITKNTPHVRSLNITEQLVIFGVKVDVTTDKVLDLIMLMAKYYIFRCRCLKTIPNFVFRKKLGKEQL